jgi:hypothetical protein
MAPRKRTRAAVEEVAVEAPATEEAVEQPVAAAKKAKKETGKTIVIEHCKSW